jgi:hypothetical protein
MERPTRFEHSRWVGDKRDQRVHDLDHCDEEPVTELMEARTYLCFGPDTLAEARNRGYRPCRCPGSRVAREAETDIDAEATG